MNHFLDYFDIKTLVELPEINEAELLEADEEEMSLFR